MLATRMVRRCLMRCSLFTACSLVAAACNTAIRAAEVTINDKARAEVEASIERWWDDSVQQGMITVGWVSAQDQGGPSTEGPRIAYGLFGASDESFIWTEFWLATREGGDQRIASTGVSMVPIVFLHRRIGVGPLIDVGFERRSERDGSVLAGTIGIGADFVVRLLKRWDFATTGEFEYRTTFDTSYQLRFSIRFHHERISLWKKS